MSTPTTPAQPIATPITALLAKWETRAANAHPSDAMLINKHIRELREAADASAAQPIADMSAPTDEPIMLNGLPVENIQLDWVCNLLTSETIFNGSDLLQAFNKLVAFYVAARAAAPWRLAEKVACWSCNYHYTESERSAADGNCPRCNVEIEVESAAPESGEM